MPGLRLLYALQYADSAYPAGGYAHSMGLETAAAEGYVTDAASLGEAVRAFLWHTVAPTDAVAGAACAGAAVAGDLATVVAVDRRLSATRLAREPREASTRMGRRLIDTAAAIEGHETLVELRARIRTGEASGNHACVLGVVLGIGGVPPVGAATLVLWGAASLLVSAALRLLRITSDDAQRLLADLRPFAARLAEAAARADPLRMAGGAPMFDLWAMRHETAGLRLFAS